MKVEKHVLPILLIVVLLTALISTYAWFSASVSTRAIATIQSGTPTCITLSNGGEALTSNSFDIEDLNVQQYQGQKGYDESNMAYSSSDADYAYSISYNLEYIMQSANDVTLVTTLKEVVIELGGYYTYTLDQTITNVFGVDTSGFSNDDYLNYYSTSLDSSPVGSSPNPFFCVYNNSVVTHLVLSQSIASNYFELDYWLSNGTSNSGSGVKRGDAAYSSAVGVGITETFGSTTSETGTLNYMGLYIGFYGYDSTSSTYCKTFAFSDNIFQESTFTIYFLMEAN